MITTAAVVGAGAARLATEDFGMLGGEPDVENQASANNGAPQEGGVRESSIGGISRFMITGFEGCSLIITVIAIVAIAEAIFTQNPYLVASGTVATVYGSFATYLSHNYLQLKGFNQVEKKLEADVSNLKSTLDTTKQELTDAKALAAKLESDLKTEQALIRSIEANLTSTQKALNDGKALEASLAADLAQAKTIVSHLEDKLKTTEEQLSAAVEKLNQENTALQTEIGNFKTENENLKKNVKAFKFLETNLKIQVDHLTGELNDLKTGLEAFGDDQKAIESLVEKQKELERKEEELQHLREEAQKTESQLIARGEALIARDEQLAYHLEQLAKHEELIEGNRSLIEQIEKLNPEIVLQAKAALLGLVVSSVLPSPSRSSSNSPKTLLIPDANRVIPVISENEEPIV